MSKRIELDQATADAVFKVAKIYQAFHTGVGQRFEELNNLLENGGELSKEVLSVLVYDLMTGHEVVREAVAEAARDGLNESVPSGTLLN